MSELENSAPSSHIMPIEATFSYAHDPPAELGEPLTREKVTVKSVKEDSETATVVPLEDAYPDGGLRAWLVVLGCFLYACTVLYVPVSHSILLHLTNVSIVSSGWALNWGILQDYFHTNMFPNTSLSVLSTIVGLANFVRIRGLIRCNVNERLTLEL